MLDSYHSKAGKNIEIPKENWDRIDWSNNKLNFVDSEEVKKNNKEAKKANKHLKNYEAHK